MIPWEGAADYYRDVARHGGIVSNAFLEAWYPKQVLSIQHGTPKAVQDPWLDTIASGPESYDVQQLEKNRSNPIQDVVKRPLIDDFYLSRTPDWSKVTVPFLSAVNWAGFGLHPRGNFEAFTNAASKQKWLECHPGRHEEWFYLDQGMALQKRFLDHFLKGTDNGWAEEPPVMMRLRRPFSADFPERKEKAWPLSDTKWTKTYLSSQSSALEWQPSHSSSSSSFKALEKAITFKSAPLDKETEITGPLAAKLFISTTTEDADLFLTFQAFAPDGREVEFQGTVDPHTPLAQGWLRASHRKLDRAKSLPYRPYHTHNELQPLKSGQIYEVDVEIWPTHIILPAGYAIALQIGGTDFERPIADGANEAWTARGSGPWLHTHPEDRPESIYGGTTTVHTGSEHESYLLLPIIEGR